MVKKSAVACIKSPVSQVFIENECEMYVHCSARFGVNVAIVAQKQI